MKNPTILKDELSLLKADRSAVLTELRNAASDLEGIRALLADEQDALEGIRILISEETARLQSIQDRVVFVRKELSESSQELKNINNSLDSMRVKNSQETKLHLGRIKDLKEKEDGIMDGISTAKRVYDRNVDTYARHEAEKQNKLRQLDIAINDKETHSTELDKEIEKKEAEEKKLTKDRLKREDKVRTRERQLEAKELSLDKREEDIITMSKDMTIMYGRLKELYAKVAPEVDLDKLILNAT